MQQMSDIPDAALGFPSYSIWDTTAYLIFPLFLLLMPFDPQSGCFYLNGSRTHYTYI